MHDRGYPRHGDAVRGAANLHLDREVVDVVKRRIRAPRMVESAWRISTPD
jgi:hypothetical protein